MMITKTFQQEIRWGYFTDLHFGANPRSRTDNYPETILDKLRKILELAEERRWQFCICGGDLLHSPKLEYPLIKALLEVLRLFKPYECPLFSLVGNHDVVSGRLDKSAMGILIGSGLVKTLDSMELLGRENILIKGMDFVEKPQLPELHDMVETEYASRILFAHQFFNEPNQSFQNEDFNGSKWSVVVLGHGHTPHESVQVYDTVIVRPGAMSRVTKADEDRFRVKGNVLEFFYEDGNFGKRSFEIPFQKGCFSDEKIAEERTKREVKDFASLILSKQEESSADIKGVLEKSCSEPDVKAVCLDYFERFGVI